MCNGVFNLVDCVINFQYNCFKFMLQKFQSKLFVKNNIRSNMLHDYFSFVRYDRTLRKSDASAAIISEEVSLNIFKSCFNCRILHSIGLVFPLLNASRIPWINCNHVNKINWFCLIFEETKKNLITKSFWFCRLTCVIHILKTSV